MTTRRKPSYLIATPGEPFLLYTTEDGRTRLEVHLKDETVWLSLNQMADLFQRDKSTVSRHTTNITVAGRARSVERVGWQGSAFVLPDAAFGEEADGERVYLALELEQNFPSIDHFTSIDKFVKWPYPV